VANRFISVVNPRASRSRDPISPLLLLLGLPKDKGGGGGGTLYLVNRMPVKTRARARGYDGRRESLITAGHANAIAAASQSTSGL
jgi:hypothetical protein